MNGSSWGAIATMVRWTLRLVLSGLFVYAGASKMRDVQAFAESVASFHLLPGWLVVPVTLGLPPLEVLAAILALLSGRWRRVGTFCLLVLLLVFTAAIASALVRNLQVDCGCFGPDHLDVLSPTKNLWFALARDGLLVVIAGWVYANGVAASATFGDGSDVMVERQLSTEPISD